MIVRIIPIIPDVSKNFETIGMTETIIVSDVPGSDNRVLAQYSETKWWTSIAEWVSRHSFAIVIVGDDNLFSHLSRGSWSHIRAKTLTGVKEVIITGCQERGEQLKKAFGILILVAKWRIFGRAIRVDVTLVEKIVQATICLHNYLCLTENANYTPAGFVDCEDSSGNIISWAAFNPNFSLIAFQIFILINLFL